MRVRILVNLDDDLKKISAKLSATAASEVILAVPKDSLIFADPINFKLFVKQVQALGKKMSLETMDTKGHAYARQYGIELSLPFKNYPAAPAQSKKTFHNSALPANQQKTHSRISPVHRVKINSTETHGSQVPFQNRNKAFEEIFNEQNTNKSEPQSKSLLSQTQPLIEKKRLWPKVTLVAFILIAVSLSLALYFYILPEAVVRIYPKTIVVTQASELTVAANKSDVDPVRQIIPGTPLEQTYEKTLTFSSSGKKEVGTKSRGQAVIYNLTGSPISLKKGTTVLNIGNRLYYFDTDQDNIKSIPARLANDPAAPLPAPVTVVSQDGGQIGNAPAGVRMEITNQVFGSRPQTLYAKTVSPIEGGESRFLSVVSEEDIAQAENKLKEAIIKEIKDDLAGEGMVLLNNSYTIDTLSFTTDKSAGTESPNFEAYLSVRIKLLAVTEDTALNLLRNKALATLNEGQFLQNIDKDSLELEVKNYDAENKILTLAANYHSTAYFAIPASGFLSDVAGKTVEFVQNQYTQDPRVDRVEIEIKPAWQKKMPYFSQKITQEVILPK